MKSNFTIVSLLFTILFSLSSFAQNTRNIVLSEGFETWPAEGWTTYSKENSGYQWQKNEEKAYAGDACAYHSEGKNEVVVEDFLITPEITVPVSGVVEFYESNGEMSYYEEHGLYVSTEGGDPATCTFKRISKFPDVYFGGDWGKKSVSLAEYAGQKIHLAFYYKGEYASWWKIDAVQVYGASDIDIEVYDLKRFGLTIEGEKNSAECHVRNASLAPASGVVVELYIDDEKVKELTKDLAIGEDAIVTFEDILIKEGQKDFTLKVVVKYPEDTQAANNEAINQVKIISNPAYGYIGYSDGENLPYGPCVFDLSDPNRISFIRSLGIETPVTAGAIANGKWYCARVLGSSGPQPDRPDKLVSIDMKTGEVTEIGALGLILLEMTWDPIQDRLLGIGYNDQSVCCLYEIDRTTGKANLIAKQPQSISVTGFAANRDGVVYCIDNKGNIYKTNTFNFFLKKVGNIGTFESNFPQSLGVNYETGDLYFNYNTIVKGSLYKIDGKTFKAELIKEHLYNAAIAAFGFDQKAEGFNIKINGKYKIVDTKAKTDFMIAKVNGNEYHAAKQNVSGEAPYSLTLKNLRENDYNIVVGHYKLKGECTETVFLDDDYEVNCEFEQKVGMDEMNANMKFAVSPNPAKDQINLTGAEKGDLQIFDALGHCVKTVKVVDANQNINVSDLNRGIYFVKLNSEKGVFNSKLILK
ncbi:MAG: choice-of-anchor J domain-containing protein [Bacteroidales bacterium]